MRSSFNLTIHANAKRLLPAQFLSFAVVQSKKQNPFPSVPHSFSAAASSHLPSSITPRSTQSICSTALHHNQKVNGIPSSFLPLSAQNSLSTARSCTDIHFLERRNRAPSLLCKPANWVSPFHRLSCVSSFASAKSQERSRHSVCNN